MIVREIPNYITLSFEKLFDLGTLKGLFAMLYVFYNFAFGGELNAVAIKSVLLLVVFDFITGIIASKKSGEVIRSTKMVRSAFKLAIYLVLIASAHVTENAVPVLQAFGDETIIFFVAVTELISIIENAGKMGFIVPQKLLNKLKSFRDNQ